MKIDLNKEEIDFLVNGVINGMRGLDYPESYPPFIKLLESIKDKLERGRE